VDQHRQVRPAQLADEAGQSGGVVEVAVTADDRLDICRILFQAAQIFDASGGVTPVRIAVGVPGCPCGSPPARRTRAVPAARWPPCPRAASGLPASVPAGPSRPARAASPALRSAATYPRCCHRPSAPTACRPAPAEAPHLCHSTLVGNVSTGVTSVWLPVSHIARSFLNAHEPGVRRTGWTAAAVTGALTCGNSDPRHVAARRA
jgi:hypothetical protein